MAVQKPFLKFFKSESTALLLFSAIIALWGMKLFLFLYSYKEPSGIDGYFYLKQILVLGTTAKFYFKDYSLGFLFPYIFYKIRPNELLAYQFSIVLYSMALAHALILISRCFWTKQENAWVRWAVGGFALCTLIFNHSYYEFSLTYLKNLAGLSFFMYGFYFLLRDQIQRDKKISRKVVEVRTRVPYKLTVLWILFFIFAVLAHKSMFVLIGLALISLQSLKKQQVWLLAAFGIISVAIFAVLYTEGWQYLMFLKSQVQNPKEFMTWYNNLIEKKNFLVFGLYFGLFSAIGIAWERRKWQRRVYVFLFLLFVFSWFPLFRQHIESPTYRYMLMHFTIAPVLLILLTSARKGLVVLSLIGVVLMGVQWIQKKPLSIYFKNYVAMGDDVKRLEKFVNVGDHLTCHHGLEFYVDYNTIIRCRSFISDERDQEKYRLVYVFESWPDKAKARIKKESYTQLGENYSLMTEGDWKSVRLKFRLADSWRNPMDKRPAHIAF